MGHIRSAIEAALTDLSLSIEEVTGDDSERIRLGAELQYASSKMPPNLWERIQGGVGRYDPMGWKAIGDFPNDTPVILFFDVEDETAVYEAQSCPELVRLLAECPGFVFYVTNRRYDFLICHNDHDYLIAAGTAKPWLLDLKL